jgi:excinuclease ABC subunit C
MKMAAKERRFEEAAAYRDTLKALLSLRNKGSLDDEMEPGVLHIDPKEGVAQLHEILKTATPPRHIEGIDIAHLHGNETVGSLVSFVDGLPSREQYRRFRIKSVAGVDDFASVREVVTRRYSRLLQENLALPDLILIDGGLGQLHAARDALNSVFVNPQPQPEAPREVDGSPAPREFASPRMPYLASLAKKEEIIFSLDHPEGIRLPRRSPALRMLQYVRDEAHRFARHYHHILRRKRTLDEKK